MSRGINKTCPNNCFCLGEQVLFPILNLIRMDIKVLGSFRQRPIASDGGQGHFGLTCGRVIPSCAFGHLLLLSLKRNIPQKISLVIRGFLSNEWDPHLPYLAVEDMNYTRTKTKRPQTNGICERFHKTLLNEFSRMTLRKKVHRTWKELQQDLDEWIRTDNTERSHQGRWYYGKTPIQTWIASLPLAKEKMLAA